MRQALRITLFVQDRDGALDVLPDLEVLHLLMRQTPLVTRNNDGSRTYVFDLLNPSLELGDEDGRPPGVPSLDRIRLYCELLARDARDLGLSLTAGLAESAELVAEAELLARAPSQMARA